MVHRGTFGISRSGTAGGVVGASPGVGTAAGGGVAGVVVVVGAADDTTARVGPAVGSVVGPAVGPAVGPDVVRPCNVARRQLHFGVPEEPGGVEA